MTAPTTLRALAAACEECLQAARNIPDDTACVHAQRLALMGALPDVTGWEQTAAALRAMADTVDALEAKCDKARALLTECAVEVEARGVDPSLAAAVRKWLEVSDAVG